MDAIHIPLTDETSESEIMVELEISPDRTRRTVIVDRATGERVAINYLLGEVVRRGALWAVRLGINGCERLLSERGLNQFQRFDALLASICGGHEIKEWTRERVPALDDLEAPFMQDGQTWFQFEVLARRGEESEPTINRDALTDWLHRFGAERRTMGVFLGGRRARKVFWGIPKRYRGVEPGRAEEEE